MASSAQVSPVNTVQTTGASPLLLLAKAAGRGWRRIAGDLVQYNWTLDALDQVHAQGLTPAEVREALDGPSPRLVQPVNGGTVRVLGRTVPPLTD